MTTYLVDTNVLVSLVDIKRPQHLAARDALEALHRQGHELATVFQNYVEFWNVATRPASKNGLGFSTSTAAREMSRLELGFALIPDSRDVYPIWRQLVVDYGVSGVQVHDAHLVAGMLAHGLTHILTFNTADFACYAPAGIVVIEPGMGVQGSMT